MRRTAVARRYAQALFQVAVGREAVDEIEADLQAVLGLLREVEDFKRVWEHVLIRPSAKEAIIERVFADRISPPTLNFLKLLCEKRRERHLAGIYEEFRRLANDARGIAEATVEAAMPLSDSLLTSLQEALRKATGKEVRIRTRVRRELLGGIVVRIGDRVIDGSVKGRLNRLRDRMAKSGVS